MVRSRFAVADVMQQVVGGILLAGPFIVTEEVWLIADRMTWFHVAGANMLVLLIGYGSLYVADRGRDPESEEEFAGLPHRFFSLLLVSYGSVLLLTYLLGVPTTFEGGPFTDLVAVRNAVSVAAIFSVVGAATADTVF